MFKRIFIFFAVSLLVSITVSLLMSVLGIGNYIGANGIQYGSLMAFCLIWGLAGSMISLMISKQLAKWTMGVQIVTLEGPHRDIVDKVHRLSRRAGLTEMPEVGIYQSDEINAFATGRSKNSSLVAVSTGLLSRMNDAEVEGVIAHEVAHIANGDMVTMALVQGVVNAFVMFFARIAAFAVSQAMRGNDDDDAPVNPWVNAGIVFLFDILFGILAMPIVAWFSRYREYRADTGGADLAGREKMIAALESLKRAYPHLVDSKEAVNPNFKSMQISSKSSMMKFFSTHPPLDERIAALRASRL
ncbi:MAG: protease HtpX [Bacteriovoracaceae bacterium]|nr:protease HtpX [Bacteriovoracaceae bacterium]